MDARSSLLPADAAGVVVLGSVVAVDPGGWYPFVVAKFAAVALAVVACWWAAHTETSHVLDRRAFRVFAALVALLAVAAVLGRERLYAWTGTPERHLGVFTWVLFLAAVVAGARLSDPARVARFVRWIVASGIALGLYSLIERWHPLIATTSDSVRLGGTYGSASFLGAALCLTLPVAVGASLGDDHMGWRLAGALSTALGTAALIGSGTRAAWLALSVGAVLVVAVRIRPAPRSGTVGSRIARLSLPVAAVVAGAAMAIGTSTAVVERAHGASSRLEEWKLGWRIVHRHAWFGVGPEGYRTRLAEGVTASYERTYGRSVLPDRAHNVLIDVAAAGGIAAAVLYLVLAALVVAAGWRAIRRGSALQVGLAVAAVVYLVQQLFLFPVATIDPVFWLVAGLLLSVPTEVEDRTPRRWVPRVAVPVLVVLFAVGVVSVAADRAAHNAVVTANAASARRAITLRPDVARYRLLAADLAPPTIQGYRAAVADLQRAHRITPHDPIVEQRLAGAFTKLAIATGEDGDRGAALAAWQHLVDADPLCYACHLGLGYAAALSGDVSTAIGAFDAAAGLEPEGVTEAADALAGLIGIGDGSGTDPDG